MAAPKVRPRSAGCLLVIAITGLLIAVATWSLAVPELLCYRVKQWPTATAIIRAGELLETTEYDAGNPIPKTRLKVNIRYEYTVDGASYTGTRYAPDTDEIFGGSLIEFKHRVRIGDRHEVHYNPSDPAEAYFTANLSMPGSVLFGSMACSAVVALLCVTYAVLVWRRGRKVATVAETGPASEAPDGRAQ